MGICLLIFNDDLRCRDITSQVLQQCNYEELHTGRVLDALNAISEKRNTLNPVLITNVHRLGEKGSQILNQIRGQLNFEIIYMTPDEEVVEWEKGEEISTSAYVVNVLNVDDINYLWESALGKEKAPSQEETSVQMAIKVHNHITEASKENPPSVSDGQNPPSVSDGPRINQKRKRKEPRDQTEQSQGSGDDHPAEKKPRVIWTKEMHRKFLEAIETLGPDKTFPKKIVELMNEPGLTRENVASHLQKYRLCLKRNQEEAASSNNGRNPCFSTFHPFGFPFQQGSCGIISMRSLGLSHPFTSPGPSVPCNDTHGLIHMQSKHFTGYPASTSFRIYGDHGTKNILLSTEDDSSSSNASVPSNSENAKSFIGLRFTTDGKSLEFGQTNASGDNEFKKEMFSSIGTSGTEIPDHSNPSTSASYSPEAPNALSQNGSHHRNELSDYTPPAFHDFIFEQEPFLALLESSVEENVADYASLPVHWTFQQNHDLVPHPCSSENPAEFLSPSTPSSHISQQQSSPPFIEVPASWESNSTLLPLYNTPGTVSSVQYPSVLCSGASMDESVTHSSSLFTPQQQDISFQLPGNVTSFQELPTSTPYQNSLQESSMPLVPSIQDEFEHFQSVEDINSFLNETAECSNPQSFWEGVYDYAHHNHVN